MSQFSPRKTKSVGMSQFSPRKTGVSWNESIQSTKNKESVGMSQFSPRKTRISWNESIQSTKTRVCWNESIKKNLVHEKQESVLKGNMEVYKMSPFSSRKTGVSIRRQQRGIGMSPF